MRRYLHRGVIVGLLAFQCLSSSGALAASNSDCTPHITQALAGARGDLGLSSTSSDLFATSKIVPATSAGQGSQVSTAPDSQVTADFKGPIAGKAPDSQVTADLKGPIAGKAPADPDATVDVPAAAIPVPQAPTARPPVRSQGEQVVDMILEGDGVSDFDLPRRDRLISDAVHLGNAEVPVAVVVQENGVWVAKADRGVVAGRPIDYPEVRFPVPQAGETAEAFAQRQTGLRLEPLLDSNGEQVRGGFRKVFKCPPPEKDSCLIKVFDPAKTVDAATVRNIQRDSAMYDYLVSFAEQATAPGGKPAFRVARMEELAPGVVKVEKARGTSYSELVGSNSPLLQKCAKELAAFRSAVGTLMIPFIKAEYHRNERVITVRKKTSAGAKVSVPVGVDINRNNFFLADDCIPTLIDW
jgi:hypothetical protein